MASSDHDVVYAEIVAILAARYPEACRKLVSGRTQRLGDDGLGFDPVTVTGILLECERHFDRPFPPALLDGGPLTIGRLVDHVVGPLAPRSPDLDEGFRRR